jgi:hypothetical protein
MNTDKKEWAREHSRREWGRTKIKTLQAGLPDFLLLFCESHTTGIIDAHPNHPWFADKVQRSTLDSRPSPLLKTSHLPNTVRASESTTPTPELKT